MPKKTVEETYLELSEIDHVLLRPDTFIGSVQPFIEDKYVLDDETGEFVLKKVKFVPGALKTVDEIIVNAADHACRYSGTDTPVTKIRVSVDRDKNMIEVWNDGPGIPVTWHNDAECYVPEMIFGRLRTGSNYDDDDSEMRFVGGRNGYGSKLANIFSSEFTVETADGSKKFRQTFSGNMKEKSEPKITKCSNKNYTKISFILDFSKFQGMNAIDDDFESLVEMRVYQISASTPDKVSVSYNGRSVPVKKFQDYVNMFIGKPRSKDSTKRFYEKNSDDTWEVVLSTSRSGFQQVSLVNSIDTSHGGKHVDYIYYQVHNKIMEMVEKKKNIDKSNIKRNTIKDRLFIFINCKIDKPAFSSQTKEEMTSPVSKFGTSIRLSDKTCEGISKEIFDDIVELAEFRQKKELARKSDGTKSSRIVGIPKLEDAMRAGTKESAKCTLILTEGDSAKALAIGALSEVGKKYYGVYPLRGKLINAKKSEKQALQNNEVNDLKKILGLRQGKSYTNDELGQLRYGRVMIMTDSDYDGFHIRGLVMNLFHTWWPELLQCSKFMCSLATPIVKATRGKHSRVFYNLHEFHEWEKGEGSAGNWNVKYYKGLGTSTKAEGKEYFRNLTQNTVSYRWSDKCDDAMNLAFEPSLANERKTWLSGYDSSNTFLDSSEREISLKKFVDSELIGFSNYSNIRQIACVVDGLKPSLRKIIFTCFNSEAATREVKVAQLGPKTAERTNYHHGEVSLTEAIVGMAQNFVGSNNIHLLKPNGQFGTRLLGGKDAASPRYIFTQLEKISLSIFNRLDEPITERLEDDGDLIEPRYYYPVVPMVLINGTSGLGTGWSTTVPSHDPSEVVSRMRQWIRYKSIERCGNLTPWVRNFRGEIEPVSGCDGKKWRTRGIWRRESPSEIRVLELPPGVWTQDFKEFLEDHMSGNNKDSKKKKKIEISDYQNLSTDEIVDFVISFPSEEYLDSLIAKDTFEHDMRLASYLNTGNMHLFDPRGQIRKYETTLDILDEFMNVRMRKYYERKDYLLKRLKKEYDILMWKVRFITSVNDRSLSVNNRSKQQIISDLEKNNYLKIDGKYDYLLSMQIWSLTFEKIQELEREMISKKEQYETLQKKTPEDLWSDDLDAFEKNYKQFCDCYKLEVSDVGEAPPVLSRQVTKRKRAGSSVGGGNKGKKKKT